MQLPSGQKISENPDAMDTEDLMEVDTLPSNEESGGEDEIAAEIERLKKQKKAQIKSELYYLKEHTAWGFVKNIPEQKFYAQKLALKRAKKLCNLNVYLEES